MISTIKRDISTAWANIVQAEQLLRTLKEIPDRLWTDSDNILFYRCLHGLQDVGWRLDAAILDYERAMEQVARVRDQAQARSDQEDNGA